ncbi:hypothetical protein ACQUQP_04480 [Marinobacterium sp. YM272]|uniref:hypothetical protein n=1 Tax=Marinobacterium sp. YM272 TaxID=3421654 RepID=UPI003D7F2129
MSVTREQHRHDYLSAIGITSWLPRTALPGAAPSADWVSGFVHGQEDVWDSEEPDSVEPAQAAREAVATAAPETAPLMPSAAGQEARAAARASLDLEMAAETKSKPKPAAQQAVSKDEMEAPRVSARPGPRVEAPRVKLAFVLAGDLLVVDSLPPAGRQGFGQQHQRLLRGILTALGQSEAPSDASLLSWPVLAGASLNQGPDELAKAVARKLELTLALKPVRGALLLGESAAQWLLGREEGLDVLRGIRFTLQGGIACVASHSLSEALQLPEMKAGIWRDIQPLRARTGNG